MIASERARSTRTSITHKQRFLPQLVTAACAVTTEITSGCGRWRTMRSVRGCPFRTIKPKLTLRKDFRRCSLLESGEQLTPRSFTSFSCLLARSSSVHPSLSRNQLGGNPPLTVSESISVIRVREDVPRPSGTKTHYHHHHHHHQNPESKVRRNDEPFNPRHNTVKGMRGSVDEVCRRDKSLLLLLLLLPTLITPLTFSDCGEPGDVDERESGRVHKETDGRRGGRSNERVNKTRD